MILITNDNLEIYITIDNIKIIDSYKITKKKDIIRNLTEIYVCDPFSRTRRRTFKSAILEWKSHNLLYKFHLFPKHTKNCDISEKEKKRRMFAYFFLGRI